LNYWIVFIKMRTFIGKIMNLFSMINLVLFESFFDKNTPLKISIRTGDETSTKLPDTVWTIAPNRVRFQIFTGINHILRWDELLSSLVLTIISNSWAVEIILLSIIVFFLFY
jgi:hypothetical protein